MASSFGPLRGNGSTMRAIGPRRFRTESARCSKNLSISGTFDLCALPPMFYERACLLYAGDRDRGEKTRRDLDGTRAGEGGRSRDRAPESAHARRSHRELPARARRDRGRRAREGALRDPPRPLCGARRLREHRARRGQHAVEEGGGDVRCHPLLAPEERPPERRHDEPPGPQLPRCARVRGGAEDQGLVFSRGPPLRGDGEAVRNTPQDALHRQRAVALPARHRGRPDGPRRAEPRGARRGRGDDRRRRADRDTAWRGVRLRPELARGRGGAPFKATRRARRPGRRSPHARPAPVRRERPQRSRALRALPPHDPDGAGDPDGGEEGGDPLLGLRRVRARQEGLGANGFLARGPQRSRSPPRRGALSRAPLAGSPPPRVLRVSRWGSAEGAAHPPGPHRRQAQRDRHRRQRRDGHRWRRSRALPTARPHDRPRPEPRDLQEEDPRPRRARDAGELTGRSRTMRILVADDETTLRTVISQVLVADGHEVVAVGSGEEALERFKADPFPLVVTDVVMGRMSGLELLSQVKAFDPDCLVVVMTSHASLETAMKALQAGAYDFLVKPFDEIELISAVVARAAEKIKLAAENQRFVGMLQEKTAQLEALNASLRDLASRDGLT